VRNSLGYRNVSRSCGILWQFNGDKGIKVMITVDAGVDNDHNFYIGDHLLIHNGNAPLS